MTRIEALDALYEVLEELGRRTGGPLLLSECSARLAWPMRGVYFFFEPGEVRADSGAGPRVVRVGTHALGEGSGTSLWNRLSQHGGTQSLGGNHRGSIFRLLVGEAIKRRDGADEPRSWGVGSDPGAAARRLGYDRQQVKTLESNLERAVSQYVRAMPFLFVAVDDEPGADSDRGRIERNSIALLSNYHRAPIDPPSKSWLGNFSGRDRVRGSGLWNNRHVDEEWDEAFLDVFRAAAKSTTMARKQA